MIQARVSRIKDITPPLLSNWCESCRVNPVIGLFLSRGREDTQPSSNSQLSFRAESCEIYRRAGRHVGGRDGYGTRNDGQCAILPKPQSELYFLLLNHWLQTCDEQHKHRHHNLQLPTRVIRVGVPDLEILHLYESNGERGLFIALSHRWGENDDQPETDLVDQSRITKRNFRTTKENINTQREGIEFNQLPKTFQDAVTVTRKLGVEYLWIDSLCIIQDDEHDRSLECKKMELVYASAYCTLAATSAKGCHDGFLRADEGDNPLGQEDGYNLLYIREVDKDFPRDVEQAELNQRGWVFQERALSRRIIHFTATQTYWECGTTVSCESADQIPLDRNPLSSSDFPICDSSNFQDNQSSAFEYTFAEYSKLSLTYPKDRPLAIIGLEIRLEYFYRTISAHGILKKFFHKSLLWHRVADDGLVRIEGIKDRNVPTWSWMAYCGRIGYCALPTSRMECGEVRFTYNRFDSKICALRAPLAQTSWSRHDNRNGRKDCEIRDSTGSLVGLVIYDERHGKDGEATEGGINGLSCITVAKGASPSEGVFEHAELKEGDFHYVLLISPVEGTEREGQQAYRRLGVAFIKDRHVLSRGPEVWVI